MKNIKQKIYNWLKWSEKYTQTDMIYLTKSGSWLLLARIVLLISSLLLSVAFANLLPKETYGSYQYILSIAALLAIPTLTGINTALMKAVAQRAEGSIIPALKTRMRWGLLGGLASLFVAGYYYLNGNDSLTIVFLIIAVFMPIMDPLGIYGSFLTGKKLFKTSAFYSAISQITNVLTLSTVIFFTNNILLIIFAYYIMHTTLRFVFLVCTIKKFKKNDTVASDTIPYGKHLSLMGIIGTIAIQADKILMWHFFGAAQLAVYAFALSPISQLRSFLGSIETLAFPKFAGKNIETIKKTLPSKMLRLFLVLIIPVGLYIIAAPYIYSLLFPQYMDSVVYSQFFALTLLFFPQKLMGTTLTAHAHKRALYVISIINPTVKILGLIILLPIFGLAGAIAALTIPYAVNTIVLTYFFRKM
ncbi:oligosaccharide flippase family protein [Patescibacteria group bacterium]